MGKVRGRFVVLLDVDQVLSLDETEMLAALGQGAERHDDAIAAIA